MATAELQDRTCVLTIAGLCDRLDQLATRAQDLDDRGSEETDAELAAVISYVLGISDQVFGNCTEYSAESLERLSASAERASKAWRYLRSGAPAVQRQLQEPTADELAFMVERLRVQYRSTSPTCAAFPGTDRAKLEYLVVPGRGTLSLNSVLFRCASLAQAARVLRAVGLKPVKKKEGEEEWLEVLGERVVCRK